MNKLIKSKKAFTIIELIVIMAILAIFVAMGAPKMTGFTKEASMTKLLNDAKVIEDAAHRYYLQHGEWPREADEMTAEEIATFTDKIYSSAGKVITLEPEGKYYGVDMMKLAGFVSVKSDSLNFILQNPVGNVYALNPENNRALEEGFIVKGKPIAVISMVPETNVSTATTISWDHDLSTSQEGYNIIDVEWENKLDKYTEVGTYTVKLRVKSSNGLWSDWVDKGFDVIEPIDLSDVTVLDIDLTTKTNSDASKNKIRELSRNTDLTLSNFNYNSSSGWTGEGLKFDGVNDYIIIPVAYNNYLRPTKDMTVTIRLLAKNWNRTGKIIGCSHGGGWSMMTQPSNGVYLDLMQEGKSSYQGAAVPKSKILNGWHTFTVTYNGNAVSIYMDGVLYSTNYLGGNKRIKYTYNNPLTIGAEADSDASPESGAYFNGTMSHISIYKKALTKDEVETLYNTNQN